MHVKNAERLSAAAGGSCRQGLTTSVPLFLPFFCWSPSPFFPFFRLFSARSISVSEEWPCALLEPL